MARGIIYSRCRFVFSGGSPHEHYLVQKAHPAKDALYPYIPDQAFVRGVHRRLKDKYPNFEVGLKCIIMVF